jgi:hypothetical protein
MLGQAVRSAECFNHPFGVGRGWAVCRGEMKNSKIENLILGVVACFVNKELVTSQMLTITEGSAHVRP